MLANMISKTSSGSHCLVLVTTPTMKVARSLADLCLDARLVACANIFPGIESHYWWNNKKERSSEILLLLKSRRECLARLEKLVIKAHPYEVPEFIVVPLKAGNARYLQWISSETRMPKVRERPE